MVQVQVNEGILEGEEVQNEYGGTFYSFRGVPYAQPPVRDLRFKAPQPPLPWSGIRDATKFGPVSYQYNLWDPDQPLNMDEDCLYLNVYTPEIKPSSLLPVMFFIHGGGFLAGSEPYKADNLVCHGDDLAYLFPLKSFLEKVDIKSETFRMINKVGKLWTNFAKYGNPTPTSDESVEVEWKPFTLEKQEYMDIGATLKVDSEPEKEEIEFWERIFKKYLPKYTV
ncbi:unnamed protein product [Arctia plantaginis]|uniref:Carboxylesterase type B domain-containing protein n=1 Tax=Arctia plantaginis TaxID=874455 RepID=A0A8S0ZL56_ARCPL|nr:unnamed protein product [Arctia plantaginis]